jgi:putative DNA methylase
MQLIESDDFPFEFLSSLAQRESWRKEIHRPIYHVHKWWAKRLGSVFRGILLGCVLEEDRKLTEEFHKAHHFVGRTVFDPFMGSGTTVGEAHKLGLTALGRDINPVAVDAVRTALGPLDRKRLKTSFEELSEGVGAEVRRLYQSTDSCGRGCDVLYHFWVMQATCPSCDRTVDLFPSYVVARNAYPDRKPQVQVVCPNCGHIGPSTHGAQKAVCSACGHGFNPNVGPARGAKASCRNCNEAYKIVDRMGRPGRPDFRLYGKLVLTADGQKEYLAATARDLADYGACSRRLAEEISAGTIALPLLALTNGYNTRQAMNYGFRSWRDFFNDRQLLALAWLRRSIQMLTDETQRRALTTLFSGVLEFNNLFASYKGEGTGAVRHMFSHHILKPERTPIEANVWGTPKSSGSFSNLFRSRLLRAIDYRRDPTELATCGTGRRVCSLPFSEAIEHEWPQSSRLAERGIYLSCGTSSDTGLAAASIELVVTDPPFFDNVHYSELADFFYAWQQLDSKPTQEPRSTRSTLEVQDTSAEQFAVKLADVYRECYRVLRDDGMLVFTYHHSRDDGWLALAGAILSAGFTVINAHPVKSEMSVATPKSQAKEPIAFDIILVCRKHSIAAARSTPRVANALESARSKMDRLLAAGFALSRNDRKTVLYGQLLTTLSTASDAASLASVVSAELDVDQEAPRVARRLPQQQLLFGEVRGSI